MRIAMIGTGYVGLVSGACFSDFGHEVTCIDKDARKIAQLRGGTIPIFEPGLDMLVARNVEAGRLSFTTEFDSAIRTADAVFLAVGTPSRRGDGFADLTFVYEAAREIAGKIMDFTVIATKSTVPVGTNDEIEAIIRKARPDADFAVVSNPEFLRRRGNRGRQASGSRRRRRRRRTRAQCHARDLSPAVHQRDADPVHRPPCRELIKYAANAFLATKITFINEMADLCEKSGVDVQEIARGMGLDRRIARQFLHAGPGFGGSCFPKDTEALIAIGQRHGTPLRIVETVIGVNSARKAAMADKVVAACGGSLRGKTVAVLGLTFKPNTDDMREAPSLVIVPALMAQGAHVRAYDPYGMTEARRLIAGLDTASDPYACVADADAMVILTEWDEFRALDLDRVKTGMKNPVVVDLRNIYRPADMTAKGFKYFGVGRG